MKKKFLTNMTMAAIVANMTIAGAQTAKTYRPIFHYSTPKNWINDPNGLVYYDGQYHLFAQYNPQGDTWGHMSWAHAVSKDLMKWEQLPLALEDYSNGDGTTTMFFSGTAVADTKNTMGLATTGGQTPLVAIYTAHHDSAGNGIGQAQSMAYSLDGKTFQRYDHNPLIDLHTHDFRDPKVFWYAPQNKWVMAVSKPLDYVLQFYSSANLKDWKLMSEFGSHVGDKYKIWECPDIFPVAIDGQKDKVKWVVTVSGAHAYRKDYEGMQYFVGDFDGTNFIPDKLNYPLFIDYGTDYYAGIIWNNLPESDNRKIMLGWVNSWEYANKIPTVGFRGQYAIPRELRLYKNTNQEYRLRAYPIAEVNKYRGQLLYSNKTLTVSNAVKLNTVSGDALDINLTIQTGTASKAGIRILENGTQHTSIYYDRKRNGILVDRTQSGNVSFDPKFPVVDFAPLESVNDKITLRILVDKPIVEVFVNNGEKNITQLVFPIGNKLSTTLFAEGGKAQFSTINIWQMLPSLSSKATVLPQR